MIGERCSIPASAILLTCVSGIPSIRSTDDKDTAKADALANAKAAVEAETEKETSAGKKREREDDDGDAERQLKKADTKEVEASA